MDHTTQQNAALVEKAAAAAQSLQERAGHLEKVVGAFKLHGSAAENAAGPVPGAPEPLSAPPRLRMIDNNAGKQSA